MILFILSFIAGVLTVLAPCVLPLLPVIVGSSVSGKPSRKKAIIITTSLGVSIVIFTLLLKVSTVFINIPQSTWEIISGVIIIAFGIVSLTPEIWEDLTFVSRINIGGNKLIGVGYKKENFLGNIIIGLSLGPVFSACSPTYFVILATVLPQSFILGLIDLIVYAIGLSLTLLLVAFLGQRIVSRLGFVSDTHGWPRRTLGLIFIILGIAIATGYEKKVEVKLLNSGVFDITKVEQLLLKLNDKSIIATTTSEGTAKDKDGMEANKPRVVVKTIQKTHGPKAPEIVNPSGFINTDGIPITISQFKGKKVILLDIWTYSCINCQRTLPYVESWYEKYKDKGLVIIGLHTPEFAFEKVKSNVEDAVKRFGLTYPVVMDNNYSTWTAYGNQYWPRKYLISGEGEIVYDHIGEGNYVETEKAIQRALLELNGTDMGTGVTKPTNTILFDPNKVSSPETYFGSNRNQYLANGKQGLSGDQTLLFPTNIKSNLLYLGGTWNFSAEFATSKNSGKIVFKYNAKNVYMVASSDMNAGITVTIIVDGKFSRETPCAIQIK